MTVMIMVIAVANVNVRRVKIYKVTRNSKLQVVHKVSTAKLSTKS